MTAALEGGEWSASRPSRSLTPRKDPVPILQEAGWAPGPVWTGGKSRPHRDFDVITSIVSFLWAYTTAARDVTEERVRTAYDVTAACYHKRRTQRNVFCHTWY